MKIALLSDLHCEYDNFIPDINPAASLCVLAGDIDVHTRPVNVAKIIAQRFNVPVVIVAGNHEFYDAEISGLVREMRRAAIGYDSIHVLENDSVVIGGVRILGCTLWTNFSLYGAARARKFMGRVEQVIKDDFSRIRYHGHKFTPADAVSLFRQSYTWLERELANPFSGKTVVVTHFAPHKATIHARYSGLGADDLTPYFTSDCSELMERYRPDLWLYGHTHDSQDVIVEGGTRVVSNQRGYPHEQEDSTGFDALKLIEL